jgi:hypothetical protein
MENDEIVNSSVQFNEKIEGIESKFFSALDDYKKYYVYYNKNPEVSEFQNYYENSKSQIRSISRDLVNVTKEINDEIDYLDEYMSKVNVSISKEREKNMKIKRLLANIKNTENGSEILIDDSKKEYNTQYYINVELVIGIFILGSALAVFFKKKAV